jgi:hypothetical protein
MEIAALKEALGDETFTELETYVSDLEGQRDQARNESISGRKGIKSELEALKGTQVTLLERLGINSIDDIDDLPDVAGMAEAGKQFEAKVKRLERQAGESLEKYTKLEGRYLGSKKEGILARALGAHEFVANDMVADHISNKLLDFIRIKKKYICIIFFCMYKYFFSNLIIKFFRPGIMLSKTVT